MNEAKVMKSAQAPENVAHPEDEGRDRLQIHLQKGRHYDMNRRDLDTLARAMKRVPMRERSLIVCALAAEVAIDNANFDRAKFIERCGLPKELANRERRRCSSGQFLESLPAWKLSDKQLLEVMLVQEATILRRRSHWYSFAGCLRKP